MTKLKYAYSKDKKIRFLVSEDQPSIVPNFCFKEPPKELLDKKKYLTDDFVIVLTQ